MNIHECPLLSNILSDTKFITQQKFIFIGVFSTEGNEYHCLTKMQKIIKPTNWEGLYQRNYMTSPMGSYYRTQKSMAQVKKALLNDKEETEKIQQ